MSKLYDPYASDDGDDALLAYVPFSTPKKDLKLSAPVSDSFTKKLGEKSFSQEDVAEVEFLGVLPSVERSNVADHIQRGEKVTMMEKVSRQPFADSHSQRGEKVTMMEKESRQPFADLAMSSSGKSSKDSVADSDESDEWFERKKKPKAAGAKPEKKEIESKTNASTIAAKKKLKGGEEKVKPKKKSGSEGKKKKKKKDMTTEELLNTFDYSLPLGSKRLPCLRAFNAPLCKCRFMGTQVRMKVKPANLPEVRPKVVWVRGVAKTFIDYGRPIPKDLGGGLRAYKCPGWTMSLNDRGGKVFGRKEGFSSGDNCKSLVIEEVKSCKVDAANVYSITEVGLTDEAVEYFHSEGARISEKR
jgi:hypothetical protein